jgi:N-acetylglucosamine-6-phosphate deacetylase
MGLILHSAKVITPLQTIEDGVVVISDRGTIQFVGPKDSAPKVEGKRIDLSGCILTAGFNDIHVHGGRGITFGIGDLKAGLDSYSTWVASTGVTGFLLSLAAPDAESLLKLMQAYIPLLEAGQPGAQALGIHLEGPFLSRDKKGAFNPAWLRSPSLKEAKAYLQAGKGWLRQMTLAPETPGAQGVAAFYRSQGVVAALGHSNADYETASTALRGDFTHITHTFNAQSGISQRAPGVIGAVLTSEMATAELIADMIHVHPGAMKLLLRCLGKDRIALITDAMAGAGLLEGEFDLVGERVKVREGKATLADGTLAGSTATLDCCVRNMVREVGVPLAHALQMASLNPAKAVGLAEWVGSIEPERPANLVVLNEELQVKMTLVNGRIVYSEG